MLWDDPGNAMTPEAVEKYRRRLEKAGADLNPDGCASTKNILYAILAGLMAFVCVGCILISYY